MKGLSFAESEAWFSSFGVKIVGHRELSFPSEVRRDKRIFVNRFSLDLRRLIYFSASLIAWLPNGCQRMLWLTDWDTYPPDRLIFFEQVRAGLLEERHVIEAPGHVFESSAYDLEDDESKTPGDVAEEAILANLFLLVACYDWAAYLVSKNQDDFICINDGTITLRSLDDKRIDEGRALMARYGLSFRESTVS